MIYPIWFGTVPALLKAFFEQVLRTGFAGGSEGARLDRWIRKMERLGRNGR